MEEVIVHAKEVPQNLNNLQYSAEQEEHNDVEAICTSDLLKKETNQLIEMNIKSDIKIQQLTSDLNEASEVINLQRSEILELQTKFENVSDLYRMEISKREETDEKISYIKQIGETSISELNVLANRAINIEKDRLQLDKIHTNIRARIKSLENCVLEISSKSTEKIANYEKKLKLLKTKNDKDVTTIERQQMENENMKLKITELQQNLGHMLKQLDEDKKIAGEQIQTLNEKLAEAEIMLKEIIDQKSKIERELKDLEAKFVVEVKKCAELNATIDQLIKEKADFQESIVQLNNNIEGANEREKDLIAELNSLKLKIDAMSIKNNDSMKMIEEKQKIIEKKTVEINNNLLIINDLNNNLDTSDAHVERLKTQINKSEKTIESLKIEITTLIKTHEEALNQKSVEFEIIKIDINTQLETEKSKIEAMTNENTYLRQELSKFQEMHDVVVREYRDTLQLNETEFNKKLEDLTNQLNDTKMEMDNKIKEKQQEMIKYQLKLREMEARVSELEKEKLIINQKENTFVNEKLSLPTHSDDDFDSPPNIDEIFHSTPKDNLNSDTDSSQASFRFDPNIFIHRNNPFSQHAFKRKLGGPTEPTVNKTAKKTSSEIEILSLPDSSSGENNKKPKDQPKKNIRPFRK